MRKAELASWEGDDDLPRVKMAREDEVEDAWREPPRDPGEVAEEDAEVYVGVGDRLRTRLGAGVGPRVDSDDLDAAAAKLQFERLVAEHSHALERGEHGRVDPLRERITAVREVVVAEDDVAGGQLAKQPAEQWNPCPARDEVAGDANEVGTALGHPGDRLLHGASPAGGNAEVEVGEVGDAQAVELGRQPLELDLDDAPPQPARLEPPPSGDRCRDRH